MWRCLLLLTIASQLVAKLVLGADPSTGPTSSAEAEILWKSSQSTFEAGQFANALPPLERLLERYPGYPDIRSYREIRFQLGKAYYETGQDTKANRLLHAYMDGAAEHAHQLDALELIGKVLLRLKRYDEAELAAIELAKTDNTAFKSRALLIKARALVGKKQINSAKEIENSAQNLAQSTHDPEIIGDSHLLRLEISTHECVPHKHAILSEAKVRSAIEEQGDCLKQSLIIYREVLETGDPTSSELGDELVKDSYQRYGQACANPPKPLPLVVDGKPQKRTQQQLESYLKELRDNLFTICHEKKNGALKFVRNWEAESPQATEFVIDHLKSIEGSLQ